VKFRLCANYRCSFLFLLYSTGIIGRCLKAIITTSTAGGGAGDATADNDGGIVGNDYNDYLEVRVKQSTSAKQTEG